MTEPLQTPLDEPAGTPDIWRNEVQARLERYKRRRGRRIEGAFTMRFPFPSEQPAAAGSVEFDDEAAEQDIEQAATPTTDAVSVGDEISALPLVAEPPSESCEGIRIEEEKAATEVAIPPAVTTSVVAPVPEPEEEPVRLIELPARPLARRKVIAFPSPSYAQSDVVRRIADPVQPEQLRILDVPEELQAIPGTPFLEGLLDAPAAPAFCRQADAIELPCATARAARRVGAASIDAVVTLCGVVIFGAAAARFLSALPPMKTLIAGTVAVSVLLWAAYQYLFLAYRGRTLGMKATGVHLQSFKGHFPDFRRRQLRVFGLYLSVLSLGMGVLWYFVDLDSLCWHDRISQTFPTAPSKS